jgi:hypothetical protein
MLFINSQLSSSIEDPIGETLGYFSDLSDFVL